MSSPSRRYKFVSFAGQAFENDFHGAAVTAAAAKDFRDGFKKAHESAAQGDSEAAKKALLRLMSEKYD